MGGAGSVGSSCVAPCQLTLDEVTVAIRYCYRLFEHHILEDVDGGKLTVALDFDVFALVGGLLSPPLALHRLPSPGLTHSAALVLPIRLLPVGPVVRIPRILF